MDGSQLGDGPAIGWKSPTEGASVKEFYRESITESDLQAAASSDLQTRANGACQTVVAKHRGHRCHENSSRD